MLSFPLLLLPLKTLYPPQNSRTFLPGFRGLVRVAHHQDVVPAAERVPVDRARDQEDLRVVPGGLPAGGAVVVPFGEVGGALGDEVQGAGLAAEVLRWGARQRGGVGRGGGRREGEGVKVRLFCSSAFGLLGRQTRKRREAKTEPREETEFYLPLSLSFSLPRPCRRSRRTRP